MVLDVIGILLVLVTFPLLAELAVLTFVSYFPARRKIAQSQQNSGKLTILIPAHNEELLIDRTVRSALAAGSPKADVLVIAHNCTDSTAKNAALAGARVICLDDPDRRGKGCALEFGFTAALEDGAGAVLVMDADSVAGEGLVDSVRHAFNGGADAVQARYEVDNPDQNTRARLMGLAFLGFNGVRPRGRERLGLSCGIVGNGFGVRADVLRKLPYGSFSVVEDLEYHLSLVRAGYKVHFLDDVAMLGQMPGSGGGVLTQRARWEGGRMRMRRQWSLRLVGEILRGRLRLIEPLFDLISQPLGNEVFLLLVALLLPVAWLRGYAAAGFLMIAAHILTAARGNQFWSTLRALLYAPVYLAWKLCMMPVIWKASSAKAAWVRTERSSAAVISPDTASAVREG